MCSAHQMSYNKLQIPAVVCQAAALKLVLMGLAVMAWHLSTVPIASERIHRSPTKKSMLKSFPY